MATGILTAEEAKIIPGSEEVSAETGPEGDFSAPFIIERLKNGGIDNLLVNGKKFVVLDYKTRGFALKEDTAEKYQLQLDVYAFLLEKMGHDVEDSAFLLFYYPKEVLETGEVVFDTQLVKMKVNPKNAEKTFEKAIKMLEGECPKDTCDWCEKV